MSFCGIGVWYPKKDCNLGTLFRSAQAFGANFIFTIGKKYKRQSSDTCHSSRNIPYYNYLDYEQFRANRPSGAILVCVEITEKALQLDKFSHPRQAIYLLGSEGGGLPKDILDNNPTVKIPSSVCLNLAVAGSVVLFHRQTQLAS